MIHGNLYWWLFCIGTFLLMTLSVEVGFRIGRHQMEKVDPEQKSQVGTVLGALLALLGFLLAFSFGIAENRFQERRMIVLKQANAIETTFLRTSFLPEPQRTEIRHLLLAYAKAFLVVTQDDSSASIALETENTENIQTQIWSSTEKVATNSIQSVPLGLFIYSLNQMIDIRQERITVAIDYHLPPSLVQVLFLVSILSTLMLGFYFGLSGTRSRLVTLAMILPFSAVLILILDIDQTRQHLFNVTQRPMEDTLKVIESHLR